MARLYADENLPLPVVEALRELGYEVLTVQETGKADQAMPDREVLAFAKDQDLVLVSLNRRHFIRLHAQTPDHRGIIVCTFDPDFVGQAQRIHEAIEREAPLPGKLLRVNRPARS